MRKLLSIVLIIISLNSFASEKKDDLLKRHYDFISTEAGGKYEMTAIATFFGDVKFMQKCAPKNAPTSEPFDIIYIVKLNGMIGNIHLFPETDTGKCIKQNVKSRVFKKPPDEFVGYIQLEFAP